MAPALVAAAVGALLAAALLGPAFDRRSVAVVVGAALVPSLDAVLSLAIHGATNAALHAIWLPLGLGLALYYDTTRRERSWLHERYGWRGGRIAWVALASYLFAGIGLALAAGSGANLFYPLYDRFYVLDGRLSLSDQAGIVQTYVTIDGGWLSVGSPGTTETYHVASWINPTPGTGVERGVERRATVVESGWQVIVVLTAVAVLAIRVGGGLAASGSEASGGGR